ncbi:zinc finger protein with KRAB and SCAN domains 1 [Pimephales promelas]|uniref:zinc finger protein with KRAB and SCAN domains 1 n=1 Tax=Pimephales promelas TaxID=90988 RepID=UPI00195597D7|nr:zinc finger protein with KRAB and SCAN domains 1 [Pimephales promelas]KAG1956373.1 gastrula zinc finger protein XlCGF8.2DB-like [Pimephales promelas]
MSEALHSFQSQLSGVMETVFKAAMFEITRLVEDSFVKEVSRSREQVEALKKRLQWSECRRKNQEMRVLRCAECGDKARVCDSEREELLPPQSENERSLKQERVPVGNWGSCELETDTHLGKERLEDQTRPSNTTESAGTEDRKLDCELKEEALYATADNKELQDGWTLNTEGTERMDFSAHSYSEQELQQIQEDWSSGLEQTADSETYANIVDVQGLPYRTHYDAEELAGYSVHELDIGNLDSLGGKTQDTLGHAISVAVGTDQKDLVEEGGRRYSSSIRSKRGNRAPLPEQVNPETEDVDRDCILINADGHIQDTSALTEVHSGIEDGAGHRGHSLYTGDTASSALYKGHASNHSLKSNVGQAGDSRASVKGYPASQRVVSSAGYTCNQCGKKFTQACNLKVHQRVHQRDGLHLCSHCGKGYSSFSDLRRHKCSQSGDKPYTCTLCGNKFSRLWNLKLHQRIHTQEKPHKCTLCSKSFTRADILKVHQRTHTGERPYCCGICGLSFKRMDHLRSHHRKHSADPNNQ